jgi:peptide methionine sulfoxide reductase MsrA
MADVDKKIQICGYGESYRKEIHVFNEEDVIKIAKTMKKDTHRVGERIEVYIKDVTIFSLVRESEDTE